MFDANLERYLVARHETVHGLAAIHFGHAVLSIDVGQAQTVLAWAYSHHAIPGLLHRDRARAIAIVEGVIAAACAPAADERGPVCEGDRAVIDKWRAYWTCTDPTWASLYCDAGKKVRAWLRQPATGIAISRLTLALFATDGPVAGQRLEKLLRQATAPPTAPAQTAAPQARRDYNTQQRNSVYGGTTRTRHPNTIGPRFFAAAKAR